MNLNERTFTAIGNYGFAQMVEFAEDKNNESSFLESECRLQCELLKDSNGKLVYDTPQKVRLCTTACKREKQEMYCSDRCEGKGLKVGTDEYNKCFAGCKAELVEERKELVDTAIGGIANIFGNIPFFKDRTQTTDVTNLNTNRNNQTGGNTLLVVVVIVVISVLAFLIFKRFKQNKNDA